MRQDDAFRKPGGAGGINQRGYSIDTVFRYRLGLDFFIQLDPNRSDLALLVLQSPRHAASHVAQLAAGRLPYRSRAARHSDLGYRLSREPKAAHLRAPAMHPSPSRPEKSQRTHGSSRRPTRLDHQAGLPIAVARIAFRRRHPVGRKSTTGCFHHSQSFRRTLGPWLNHIADIFRQGFQQFG